MENKVKFVSGLRAFKPHEKAPSYVKMNATINRNELMTWLNQQKEEVRIVLKESKNGSYYFSVDDFEPTKGSQPTKSSWQEVPVDDNSLPF